MTKNEAAIISAYTGFLVGGSKYNYARELKNYASKAVGRPLLMQELLKPEIQEQVRRMAESDFHKLEVV